MKGSKRARLSVLAFRTTERRPTPRGFQRRFADTPKSHVAPAACQVQKMVSQERTAGRREKWLLATDEAEKASAQRRA